MSEDNIEQPIKSKASLRFEEIRKESESIKTLAKWLLLVAGTIFFLLSFDLLVSNYVFKDFTKETLEAFGTFAAGTSGVIIGASTIVFLIYNIRIQNASLLVSIEDVESSIKEMKDSNENFLSQKAEHLFFNLIESHNKLINYYGADKLNSYYNDALQKIRLYYSSIRNKHFKSVLETNFSPETFYRSDTFIRQSVESAKHIINFIESRIQRKEKLFFHQTFYNSLNTCVKFFLSYAYREGHLQLNFDLKHIYINEFHNNLGIYVTDESNFPTIQLKKAESINQFEFKESQFNINEVNRLFNFLLNKQSQHREEKLFFLGYTQTIKLDNKVISYGSEDSKVELAFNIDYAIFFNLKILEVLKVEAEKTYLKFNTVTQMDKIGFGSSKYNQQLNYTVCNRLMFKNPVKDSLNDSFTLDLNFRVQLIPTIGNDTITINLILD